jgi:GGDEF domain-containing protein
MAMRVFDEVNPATIERRESHLWILALTIIFVLTAGLALMMYPRVFGHHAVLDGWVLKAVFFGFCALSLLVDVYLAERQLVIGHLRKQLAEENARFSSLREQASEDMVASLPGIDRFRDCLAMEFRRASNTKLPITLVTVGVQPLAGTENKPSISVSYGDALKALARILRCKDSIYHFAPGVFGVVLPGVSVTLAQEIVRKLGKGLQTASGSNSRFSYSISMTNFPNQVATAREMEEKALAVLPANMQLTLAEMQLAV